MRRSIKAFVYWGETHYVAECPEVPVVTQGKTLDETIANLQEAVALYLEGEDPIEFAPHATGRSQPVRPNDQGRASHPSHPPAAGAWTPGDQG